MRRTNDRPNRFFFVHSGRPAMAGRVDPDASEVPDPPETVAYVALTGEAPTPEPGAADATRIAGGRFQVVRRHARGGLGEVFLAFDRELNRSVALKELLTTLAHDPAAQARFLLEAEVTGSL